MKNNNIQKIFCGTNSFKQSSFVPDSKMKINRIIYFFAAKWFTIKGYTEMRYTKTGEYTEICG
jgi:hypothetical protein